MRHSDFRSRALQEVERYGADDWVFLRELAQNARDARAKRIEVRTGVDADGEWLSFDDDGMGMSFAHARAYLFRLYASSKEGDVEAAGRFGVGFWSVLRFCPETIVIASRRGGEAWAVSLAGALADVRPIACDKPGRGTRVTLRRSARAGGAERFAAEVERALRRYCRFLRRAGRRPAPLPITCNGQRVNEELAAPGPISLSFQSREAEGAVGLAEEPRVEVYARGLLVQSATVLDELYVGAPSQPPDRTAGGLAPVVLLNSNRLDLVLSRQGAVNGRHLRRLVRLARDRVSRVVDEVMDGARPRSALVRLVDRLPFGRRSLAAGLVLMIGASGAWSWLATNGGGEQADRAVAAPFAPEPPSLPPRPAAALPYTSVRGYRGATVEVLDGGAPPWDLAYEGPGEVLFRVLTLDRYDPESGWMQGDAGRLSAHPPYRCVQNCIRVRLRVLAGDEPLVLPVPTAQRVEPDSVRFNGERVAKIYVNERDEAAVRLSKGAGGTLEYVTGRAPSGLRPAPSTPVLRLPAWLEDDVELLRTLPPGERARRAAELVRGTIAYDTSPAIARAYEPRGRDWLARVLAVRAGDCDVKNGVAVLLLRHLGIPARLAIGIAGHEGRARPYLHAWAEYYVHGWQVADATGEPRGAYGPRPTAGPVAAETVAGGARAPRPAPPSRPGPSPAAEPPVDTLAATLPWDPNPAAPPWPPSALLVSAGALAVALVWHRRARVRERVFGAEEPGAARVVLARVMRDALLHPEAWRHATSLWHRRVLPTIGGRLLSLAEALAAAEKGGLFASRRRTRLAQLAARGGAVVLDAGDAVLGGVSGALGACVDLDALDPLRPAGEGAEAPARALETALVEVNRVLARSGSGVECHSCPGLRGVATRDVDLAAVRLGRRAPWPRRYVAVNPWSPEVAARARPLLQDPRRGAFGFIEWLVERSELLAEHAPRAREQAAWAYLEAR